MPMLYKNREPLVVGVSMVDLGIGGTENEEGGGFVVAVTKVIIIC